MISRKPPACKSVPFLPCEPTYTNTVRFVIVRILDLPQNSLVSIPSSSMLIVAIARFRLHHAYRNFLWIFQTQMHWLLVLWCLFVFFSLPNFFKLAWHSVDVVALSAQTHCIRHYHMDIVLMKNSSISFDVVLPDSQFSFQLLFLLKFSHLKNCFSSETVWHSLFHSQFPLCQASVNLMLCDLLDKVNGGSMVLILNQLPVSTSCWKLSDSHGKKISECHLK